MRRLKDTLSRHQSNQLLAEDVTGLNGNTDPMLAGITYAPQILTGHCHAHVALRWRCSVHPCRNFSSWCSEEYDMKPSTLARTCGAQLISTTRGFHQSAGYRYPS